MKPDDRSNEFSISPHYTTRELIPENQETPIHFLRHWITPEDFLFLRNHFPYPSLKEEAFLLPIDGEVKQPKIFRYGDLLHMPSRTVTAVLECSGNKRAYFCPQVYGVQWEDGALCQAIWKGVSLSYLLSLTEIADTAVEVVFEGYDAGKRTDIDGVFHYARSLPISKAICPDTLIAYELNGKILPYKHGYPLRLIVPQWYGMAWVKWLKRITVINHHFTGPFQEIDYNYYPCKENDLGKRPVTTINVNSIIQYPLDLSEMNTGTHYIEGLAWTGEGIVSKVEISTDYGQTWHKASLNQDLSQPYSWVGWTYVWMVGQKGEYTIFSRATDTCGRTQPFEPEWNRKGYGYNGIASVRVKIE
ncbi:MAG TPA: sulfite oxidase [Bacillota bacterium]|nr:sulfite oxidase [Bacillota bacterium]